ncbi:transcription initiation factor TFIID subunit 8-like [Olea europaea var. sylvestris]|uniref:transcription initiation factor TFIID subunit 8-like n=1 Tax=Olea europaea var. sylvestris TaxID=158386 RepID=UPI000C1D0E3A|nr:transcription initiation factor TFIID subunit 8-like [Olea europaea var. sylvestris]
MSDGGKAESKIGKESTITRAGEDNFGRAISKIAVAQICENVGFESINESALDSLADLAIRYLLDLGKTAKFYSNLAGRTECNVFDIIQGLEDLGMSTRISGASEVGFNCAISSGVVTEIRSYVESAEETPFAQPVPHFPVVREWRLIPSFLQMGETPGFKHIPKWLPAFPDPHTYIHSAMWNERVSDPRTDKIELARQHRKAERALLSLQKKLVCNGLSVASTSAEPDDGRNSLEVNDIKNQILANPLEDGERDDSPVVLPGNFSGEAQMENHVSLLETFAPAIEAMKDGLSDSGNDGEKSFLGKRPVVPPAKISGEAQTEKHVSLLDTFAPAIEAMKDGLSDSGNYRMKSFPGKRPAVCLEFKGGKKVFGESLDLRIRNNTFRKTAPWFGREDEKDDKKRRIEFILRQSMENQQELT